MFGAAGAGAVIQLRVIGASGEADGFRRIVRRTIMAGAGAVPTVAREIPIGAGAVMAAGKAPMEVGAITAGAGVIHRR